MDRKTIMTRRGFLAFAGIAGASLLAACSSSNTSSSNANGSANTTGDKTLVAYFSASGHTRAVAEEIASHLGADIFEITPVNPYTEEDLDYNNDDSRVAREHNDTSLQNIELTQVTPDNFQDYSTVFFGYPIWWMNAAWPVNNFASGNDFTGKTVIPFCTSYSSGIGRSGDNLASMAGTGDWQTGHRFDMNTSMDDVDAWVDSLNL